MKVIELLKSKEWSGKVIDCVLRFALSFALALAQVFGGYAPLALGMIGASGAGLRGVSALIGASAGAVLFLPFSHALRTFAAGVLIFTANNAFFDLKLYKKRAFLPLLCAGMMFSVEFVYVLRDGVGEAANCLMALLLCALGAMSGRALLATGDREKEDHPYAPLFILLGVLMAASSFETADGFAPGRILSMLAVLLFALVMIVVVTFVDMGVRRIQVQYAKRVTGRKMYGGQSSILPLKVCSVGVMPLIFAYSFMAFPSTLIQLFGGSESGLGLWWSRYMNYYSPLYMIVTALLIIAFTYFYTSISFQPDEMAKNIQQQGGVIPHVRPGKPTADFLARTNNRLTLFAALFLAVLATLPNLFTVGLQTSVPFAASSLLIAVSVVLETKRQLDDLLVSRNYDTLT